MPCETHQETGSESGSGGVPIAAPASAKRRSRLRLTLDPTRSLRGIFRELLRQAENRDSDYRGPYFNVVLTHLVAATLDSMGLPGVAEPGSDRLGDPRSSHAPFEVGDTHFHVAGTPTTATFTACRESLGRGYRCVLITVPPWGALDTVIAQETGFDDQLDVVDFEHFVTVHLGIRSRFRAALLPAELRRLVTRYNEIVDRERADPSLKIQFRTPRRAVRPSRSEPTHLPPEASEAP